MDKKVYEIIKGHADRGDREALKYVFVDALDVDPTFARYEDGYNYCKSIPGLLENHIELTPFIYDSTQWNEVYWTRLRRDLEKNFSDRRMSHMKDVAQVFLAEKIHRIQAERAVTQPGNPVVNPVQPSSSPTKRVEPQAPIPSLSKAEEEQIKLEQARKRLAEEEAEKEKQRKLEAYRKQQQQQREQELRKQQEEATSKKMKGVALVVSIVVAVIALLLILVQCNPLSVKQMEYPDSQEQPQISTVQQM